jgi:hypothetical protein
MRKLWMAAVLFAWVALPSSAFAQFGYAEGSIGFALPRDADTDDFSAVTPAGLFEGTAQLDYNSHWTAGLEAGYITGPWRFGVSWDFFGSEVESADVAGTLDGTPFTANVTDQELHDVYGLSGNNDINLFAVNGYYTFGAFDRYGGGSGFQPYLGLGVGLAAFQDADATLAFTGTAGVNVALGPNAYLGGRYRLAYLSEHEHDSGVNIRGIWAHTLSLVLGIRSPF